MRIPRIYTAQALGPEQEIVLEKNASNHLLKVLRMEAGRSLILFNGDGHEYAASIVRIDKKQAVIFTNDCNHRPNNSPMSVEIAIGISKGDRLDWVVQKATELGVNGVYPLYTSRCEIKLDKAREEKKRANWTQIAISACEQCQRNTLPEIHQPMSLNEYLDHCDTECKFVMHHRADASLEASSRPKSLSFVIGPEGGLDDQEINDAQAHGFKTLSLGNRVLRTETAPIVALSISQFLWGDLGEMPKEWPCGRIN